MFWLKLTSFLFYLGAFLIPYFFSMLICGIPMFFLEVSVGQYLGVGGMSVVGQLAPIFKVIGNWIQILISIILFYFHSKGVGYSAIMMVFLENVYYIIVITWTLFYLFNTFMDLPSLPWSDCSKGSKHHLVQANSLFFEPSELSASELFSAN